MVVTITDNNRGPLVNIAIWITLAASTILAGLKVYIKWHAIKGLGADDVIAIVAYIIAIGQVATISIQVDNGLGRHRDTLSTDQVYVFYKAQYATQILYACGVSMTKLVPLYFFPAISPSSSHRRLLQLSIAFVWLWTGVAVLVTVFSCGLPYPWQIEGNRCINPDAFWGVFTVVDVLTQLLVSFLPILLLRNVQMTQHWKKVFSMLCFTPNSLTIPISVLRYIYLLNLSPIRDLPWNSFAYTLTTGLHPHLSLIFASTSFIKPFVDSLVVIPQVVGSAAGHPHESDNDANPSLHAGVYHQPAGHYHSSSVTGGAERDEWRPRGRGRGLRLGKGKGKGDDEEGKGDLACGLFGGRAFYGWGGKMMSTRSPRLEEEEGLADSRPYAHLGDEQQGAQREKRMSEPKGPKYGVYDSGLVGRPLAIWKTVSASVSSEPR